MVVKEVDELKFNDRAWRKLVDPDYPSDRFQDTYEGKF
jgi:hypothetical protein